MTASPETPVSAENNRFYDKPLLAFLGAVTFIGASALGAGLSVEASEISAGNMPELQDVSSFGLVAAGVAIFGTWLQVHIKTMRDAKH